MKSLFVSSLLAACVIALLAQILPVSPSKRTPTPPSRDAVEAALPSKDADTERPDGLAENTPAPRAAVLAQPDPPVAHTLADEGATSHARVGARGAAPRASIHDGLLTIDAENASLGEVMKAVQRATGATVESSEAIADPVTIHLGPAEPRVVLASLLDGSHYDYVLLAAQSQPNRIERILLGKRRDAGSPALSADASGTARQPHVTDEPAAAIEPVPDTDRIRQEQEEQRLQMERQFGACVAQGCDAS